jgi:formate-dependent nitrite reductase membrane component NrfD
VNPPPSTLFTAPTEWQWLIIFYFYLGGIAGGAYFLATLIDLAGHPADRPLARLGYFIAFPAIAICGLLLIADLRRPLRFWHMLVQSETLRPMLKWWSPMSFGSWILLLFGLFAFLSFLAALGESDDPRWRRLRGFRRLRRPGLLGTLVTCLGGVFGFFIAGYTGILLAVTNRPIWSDTNLLGLVFLISGTSTAAALMALLGRQLRWTRPEGVHALERFDSGMLVFELIAIVALVISLGSLARLWLSAWGALLVVGVLIVGILVPLVLYRRPGVFGRLGVAAAPVLVLVGGFLLRVVIILSSEAV